MSTISSVNYSVLQFNKCPHILLEAENVCCIISYLRAVFCLCRHFVTLITFFVARALFSLHFLFPFSFCLAVLKNDFFFFKYTFVGFHSMSNFSSKLNLIWKCAGCAEFTEGDKNF